MSDQLLSIGNTVAWLVDVLDKIIFNWLNSYSSQVSTWKLCSRLMLKSVATIIVVTNLIPNGPSKAAFTGSRFERCIVILTDNIFLSENLFVLEEWQCIWMAMEQSAKKIMHSQISDLNVKLEIGDGVKMLIFLETTNDFSS